MDDRRIAIFAGSGCIIATACLGLILCAAFFLPFSLTRVLEEPLFEEQPPVATVSPGVVATQEAIPTLPAGVADQGFPPPAEDTTAEDGQTAALFPGALPLAQASELLTSLYQELNPGVVSVQVYLEQGRGGVGAGSGFILDNNGHIVTNNHVVVNASQITVVFYNGMEVEAEVLGTDDDSDLAILRVDTIPEGAHPLPLADSDDVETGQWAIAIGNPFRLGGSMSVGIVSAVGRVIPSGATLFSIPQAIQTDAAINPGNSGGPLLNLNGQVIGVNAQIRTSSGAAANTGVGFAIPSNVVRLVAPVLIERGAYQWPWLGVEGDSVNLFIMRQNNLDSQLGAYIATVRTEGPAADAGLQAGDVIVEANGEVIDSFDELLTIVAFSRPGEEIDLVVSRNGEQREITVTLAARPE